MSLRSIVIRAAAAVAVLAAPLLLPGAAAAQCARDCVVPGDRDVTAPFEGIQRSFKLHVPPSYDGKRAVTLLIDLHGYSSSANDEREKSGQLQQADKRGFIVAYPEGLKGPDGKQSWNGYACCGDSVARNVRDVAFLRAVIALIKQYAFIDPARVYVTGISNGGSMAHRMACESADVVRAVATVSFPLNRRSCAPAKPITVYSIAGTGDQTIYYNGLFGVDDGAQVNGLPVAYQSAENSLVAWKGNDGCTSPVVIRTLSAKITEGVYQGCRNGVRTALLKIEGGPHVLYNRADPSVPIDVSEYIWNEAFK